MRLLFDELKHGARYRLQALHNDAQKLASNPHRNMQCAANPTWRTVRYHKFSGKFPVARPGFNDAGNGDKTPILSTFNSEALPIRRIEWCDEVKDSSIDHQGWFTSDHGEKARGFVASLPHGRFLPGYFWSSNDEYVLFIGADYLNDSAEDCAREADSLAESFADDAHEDSERFDAMQDAESATEEKREALAKALALRHNPRFGGMDAARKALQEYREAMEDLQEKTAAYEKG
jgi:hypothetical protein